MDTLLPVEQPELLMTVFGAFDENIKLLERELDVSVVSRGQEIKISGEAENVGVATRTLGALLAMAGRGEAVGVQTVQYVIGLAREDRESEVHTMSRDVLCITAKGKPVKAKTLGQKRYMEAIRNNTIVMGVGPAGTGKTYLAVAAAVADGVCASGADITVRLDGGELTVRAEPDGTLFLTGAAEEICEGTAWV